MVQSHSLDSVIKKTTSFDSARGIDEEKVIVHRNRREIVKNPWPWQPVQYYLVSFNKSAECNDLTHRILDFASNGFIELSISYRVSCTRENASKVVLALYGDSPFGVLNDKIRAWIDQQTEGNTHHYVSDINACFSGIWQIQQMLAQKVRTEIGLNFESRISIFGISNFRPFAIEQKRLKCSISDFSSGRTLDITIDYRATCDSSNIGKTVLVLYGSDLPINVLNEKIKIWVKSFSNSRAAQIIGNFDLETENLTTYLCQQARNEVGLNLETRISSNFQQVRPVSSEELKPFSTGLLTLSVRITDYDQPLELELEAILEVDPANRSRAFSNRGREILLVKTIEETVKNYFLQNTNLHKFFTELQYSVRQELEDDLDRALADKGRKIAYLTLSSKAIDEIRDRLELKTFLEIQNYSIECPLQDLKDPIRVNNSISLQLIDLSRYRIAVENRSLPQQWNGKPDLEEWLKVNLKQDINALLPQETFSDLLLEFEPIVSEEAKTKGTIVSSDRSKSSVKGYSEKLFGSLEKKAARIGYHVAKLLSEPELDVRGRFALAKFEFLEINDHVINCTVKGFNKPIQVNNTLHLQIVDVWKYSNAVKTKQIPLNDEDRKPDLEKWAKHNIEKIVKPLLLKTEYVDLLPEQGIDNYASAVLEKIQEAARGIGYEVTQIISIPELEQVRALRENFTVKTGAKEYPTKDPNCPVKLDTTVVMKVENLTEIGERLRRSEINLESQIGNRIYEIVSRIMNGIDPERFFMRFDSIDEKIRGEKKSVEQELHEAIDKELAKAFKATIFAITLKIVDTDLIKLFKSLQSYNSTFTIEFEPASGDVEQVTFFGKFQVLSVAENDWNKFQTKFRGALTKRSKLLEVIDELEQQRMELEKRVVVDQDEIDTLNSRIETLEAEACGITLIRQNIESDLRRIVRRNGGDIFRHSTIQDLMDVKNRLNSFLGEGGGSIRDLYGLIVQVSQLDCPVKESEEIKAEKQYAIDDKQYAIDTVRAQRALNGKRIAKLEEQLLELTGQAGVDDEIEKIESNLEKLYDRAQSLSRQLEEEKKVKKSLEPQKSPTGRLSGTIPKQRNLLAEDKESQKESQASQSQTNSDNSAPSSNKSETSSPTIDISAQPVNGNDYIQQ